MAHGSLIQVYPHGLVGEVGALITITYSTSYDLTAYDSSFKQKKAVMVETVGPARQFSHHGSF